ncbi:MAG: hypothetical protein EBQ87_14505 [Planctomycetes bacterium]|nr:hypothetical protein [Planctomycetota bacterium]
MASTPENDQTLAPNNLKAAPKSEDVSLITDAASGTDVSMSPEHKEGLAKIAADFGAETIAPMHKASTDTEHDVTLGPSPAHHRQIDSTMNLQIPQFDANAATMPPSGGTAFKNDPNAATMPPSQSGGYDPNGATMPLRKVEGMILMVQPCPLRKVEGMIRMAQPCLLHKVVGAILMMQPWHLGRKVGLVILLLM